MEDQINKTVGGARVAVIGELNIDLVATGLATSPVFGREILAEDFQMTLGSASAIFASGVAKLGNEVVFFSEVGHDYFGRFCRDALRDSGVSDARVIVNPDLKTGVTISLSTHQDRALVTYLGAIAELRAEQLELKALEGCKHLHLTSYFLQHGLRPSFPQILKDAKQMGLTTSFDPNSDPTSEWGDNILEVVAQTDILFLNETEAMQLTHSAGAEEALEKLGELVNCAVVKLGAKGAVAIKGGEMVTCSGFEVNAVDTTGAGDSFAAGFVSGFFSGRDLRTCLLFGNACGALSTLKPGGTAGQPTLERLQDFLKENNPKDEKGLRNGQ